MHHEHKTVVVVQVPYRAVDTAPQVRVGGRFRPGRPFKVVPDRFHTLYPLALAQPGQDNRSGDPMEPTREGCVAAEINQSVESPDERVLGQIFGPSGVSGHPVGQTEHAVDMRVVKLPFGGGVSSQDPADQ